MKSSQIPVARKEGLVIQETTDEVLVYDLTSNKAHCLNQTAALVWKSCDGHNSITDITRLLATEAGGAVPEDLIWLAIDQLNEKELLEKEMVSSFAGRSRREVLKKIGLATVVAFLAGPESTWITGQMVHVDGGHHLRRGPNYHLLFEQ